MRNAALIVVAAVVLVVGLIFVVGADNSDAPSTANDAAATTTETVTSAPTPAPGTTSGGTSATGATPAPEPEAAPAPEVPTVTVAGGKPDGGVQKLAFAKGDEVRFKVVSDVADEIHVHGFDLMKDVEAGGSVSFDFPARFDGKYEVELEGHGTQIASLEIQP